MVAYDTDNSNDEAGALGKVANLKVPYDPEELVFWFGDIERSMKFMGVRSQLTKLQVLTTQLPSEVKAEIKPYLHIDEEDAEALASCYKSTKKAIIELFGPKKEEAYDKAIGALLTSKPSQLAKKIMDLLCRNKKTPLTPCCCDTVVYGIWKKQLPEPVLQAIAGMPFDHANLKAVLDRADAVYLTLPGSKKSSQLAGIKKGAAAEIAGVGRGRGNSKGNRGRGNANAGGTRSVGRGQGQSNSTTNQNRGPKHADGPPDTACFQHYKYGKSAYYCRRPKKCPWVSYIIDEPEV